MAGMTPEQIMQMAQQGGGDMASLAMMTELVRALNELNVTLTNIYTLLSTP